MKFMQALFLFFLLVPFVEIYVLLEVGSLIGAFPTIVLVVFTAVLGAWLLRHQGFNTWRRFQTNLQQGVIPTYEIIEGPILLVGGALLLTPGFFSDLLGFACLIPALRRKIAQFVIENYLIADPAFRKQSGNADRIVIDGEFRKEEDDK